MLNEEEKKKRLQTQNNFNVDKVNQERNGRQAKTKGEHEQTKSYNEE